MNRPADAIAAGERAVKANPSNPEANWILGSLYARMAEMPNTREPDRRSYTQRAIANLEKANRNAHPSVPMMLGRLYVADRPVREGDRDARAVRHRSARSGRGGRAAGRGLSGDRSRCRGDRAARKVGARMRRSCTARLGRSIRMPGGGTMPPARFRAPSRSGRRVCRCARSGRPRC